MLEIIVNIALIIITLFVIISFIVNEESAAEHPLPKSKDNNQAFSDAPNEDTSNEPKPLNESYTPIEYSKFNFSSTTIIYLTLASLAFLGCILGFIAQVLMENDVLAAKAATFTLICLFTMFGLWRGYLGWVFCWWK